MAAQRVRCADPAGEPRVRRPDRNSRRQGARGHSADALDGAGPVPVCLDRIDTGFVEQCLSGGIHNVDISADCDVLSRVETLDDLAKRHGATPTLSIAVAPGLTSLLAACAREGMNRVERIDILLEFGLGDRHGQAVVEWMSDILDAAYEVKEGGGGLRSVRSFGESLNLRPPGQGAAGDGPGQGRRGRDADA